MLFHSETQRCLCVLHMYLSYSNFPETRLWKGFGNTQEDVFISCFDCKARMHLFLMWFSLSMGGFCFLILISKTVGWLLVLLMYYSGVFWNNNFFCGVLERTHC
jgi:hypothetical protein